MNIVFTEATGIIPWVIRKFTGGRATHVAIQIDEDVFIHADIGGVQVSTLSELLADSRRIYAAFRAKPHVEIRFDSKAAMELIGQKYDYDGLLGFVPVLVCKKILGINIKNPFADPHEYICSEFVCSRSIWARKHGIPEFSRLDPELVTPHALYKRLLAGHSFTKIS